MIHLVVTKHLVYEPKYETVCAREDSRIINICSKPMCVMASYLGDIWHGPHRPIPDEVQSEWIDLIEWEAISQARR